MVLDEEYLSPNEAVHRYGTAFAKSIYERERERALDRDDQEEADCWEAKRQSIGAYVARRRLRYNLFSLSAGGVIALFPAVYVWVEGEGVAFAALTFIILTGILYATIRFIDRLFAWVGSLLELSAVGSLGWQLYIWLREARWPGLSVGDAFSWIGIKPSYVSVEGWVGVSKIVNASFMWIFELSLPLGCFFLGFVFIFIGGLMEIFDIPKMEEEEI